MMVKYYGIPCTADQLRMFIKQTTGILVTKIRAERMFYLYSDVLKHPIMANSTSDKDSSRDLLLLYKAGLVYPMYAPLTISNAKDWLLKKIDF